MSIIQAAPPPAERGSSPLASNNPFRNRVSSGAASPALSPQNTRPFPTNPFLDASEMAAEPSTMTTTTSSVRGPSKSEATDKAADIFSNLSLDGGRALSPDQRAPVNGASRRENMPPPPYGRFPPPNNRPTISDEERRRQQNKMKGRPPAELDIFADPPAVSRPREKHRPRRNSESSVRDKPSQLLDPQAEQRRRERRHREGKSSSSKSKRANAKLDLIDRLDVTSIYGTGLFHHDGPFDACNPHRNRKGAKQAPMQAFPKDSINMQIGGAGPVHSKLDLAAYHGITQEAHVDFNEAAVVDEDAEFVRRTEQDRAAASFNPIARIELVHGNETAGLGTSTFLEGTPASRADIARQTEIEAAQLANGGGLSRKKSLAQKIRSVRPNLAAQRVISPEPMITPTSPEGAAKSNANANPFFKDYDKEYDKKGAQIAFAEEQQKPGRARAPSSPKRGYGLERKMTGESTGGGGGGPEDGKTGARFLNRVKSLKGRNRPRRDTSA